MSSKVSRNYIQENKNFCPKPIDIPKNTYELKFGQKFIKTKEEEIISLQNQILAKRDEGFKVRNNQRKDFEDRLAFNKAAAWKKNFALQKDADSILRMPDQQLMVRAYSLIDNDLWMKDSLRDWFNKYVSKEGDNSLAETLNLVESGYINEEEPSQRMPVERNDTIHHNEKSHFGPGNITTGKLTNERGVHDSRHRSVYLSTHNPEIAGLRNIDPLYSLKPHWSNDEENLKLQKKEAHEKLMQRNFYPITEAGHVPGCRRNPWKDRTNSQECREKIASTQTLIRRENLMATGNLGMDDYRKYREEAKQRKSTMQAGVVGEIFKGKMTADPRYY